MSCVFGPEGLESLCQGYGYRTPQQGARVVGNALPWTPRTIVCVHQRDTRPVHRAHACRPGPPCAVGGDHAGPGKERRTGVCFSVEPLLSFQGDLLPP